MQFPGYKTNDCSYSLLATAALAAISRIFCPSKIGLFKNNYATLSGNHTMCHAFDLFASTSKANKPVARRIASDYPSILLPLCLQDRDSRFARPVQRNQASRVQMVREPWGE